MCRLLLVLIVLKLLDVATAIQINYIKVPQAVRNNSGQSVVLDCNYSVRPDDTELVLKWFLNGELVYQWLPPQKPQSFGPLKNRVDLDLKTGGDSKTVHRALKIINPTSDIAGEYKCFVSTFADEDFSAKTMIVFEPESSLILYRSTSDGKEVNFTCFATEVYPQPKVILYTDKQNDENNKNLLEPLEWNTKRTTDGKYSILLTSTIALDKLDYGSLIFCELRISGTGYIKRKSLLYYPQDVENWNGCRKTLPMVTMMIFIISSPLIQ